MLRKTVHDKNLYKPAGDEPPIWWMRGILILTCTGVSFAHGTNDGQKSIGLIMLTIIGLFPAYFALNPESQQSLSDLPQLAQQVVPLIDKYGNDRKQAALETAKRVQDLPPPTLQQVSPLGFPQFNQSIDQEIGMKTDLARERATVRDDMYRLISQLEFIEDAEGVPEHDKTQAKELAKKLGDTVEYAPWWVRILSALCLGIGTMIGYKRIVTTLGERLGNIHLTPAQGASAELVSAVLIGISGFTGLPVSTTHIVTSGIAGTMVSSGAGLRYGMLSRIAIAWLITLPVTITIAALLYYLLESPGIAR
jgi:PiT family inorganic phosphate transporter